MHCAYTNSDKKRAYQREYARTMYHLRRNHALERLGGVCTTCGTTEWLTFRYVEPTTEPVTISLLFQGASQERIDQECTRYHLICRKCKFQQRVRPGIQPFTSQ